MSDLLKILVVIVLALTVGACKKYDATQNRSTDGTIFFNPKNANGVSAGISFCKNYDEQTGERHFLDTVFTMKEAGYIRALIDLKNQNQVKKHNLMFHIDWITPQGKSLFKKQILLDSQNPDSIVYSSISVFPGERNPGRYSLRVYYFRELIAEKYFSLLSDGKINTPLAKRLLPEIVLCRDYNRKSGERFGIDTVFSISETKWLRAFVDIRQLKSVPPGAEKFRLGWAGPDDEVFFSKELNIPYGDSETVLYSSIKATPGKREPGTYALNVFLDGEWIAEKTFCLVE